jgi:hypothetical protein
MNTLYIVTNNAQNELFLRELLPTNESLQIFNAQDGSSAEGWALSRMTEGDSAILIVDPDPTDPTTTNAERERFWQAEMRRTGMEGLVIVAEPDVPTAITPDAPLTRKLFAFIEQALLQVR